MSFSLDEIGDAEYLEEKVKPLFVDLVRQMMKERPNNLVNPKLN